MKSSRRDPMKNEVKTGMCGSKFRPNDWQNPRMCLTCKRCGKEKKCHDGCCKRCCKVCHPEGPRLKRGRPTKEELRARSRAQLLRTPEELPREARRARKKPIKEAEHGSDGEDLVAASTMSFPFHGAALPSPLSVRSCEAPSRSQHGSDLPQQLPTVSEECQARLRGPTTSPTHCGQAFRPHRRLSTL